MKITGEHTFVSPPDRVWAALQDPRMLAGALPGARRLEVTGPDTYALTVSIGVGSVRGTYHGTFKMEDKRELEACTVRASASGGPGSVEAVARMRLREGTAGGAVMAYEADANVTGPLAGVGQRLVGGAARKTTTEFLAGLDRQIVGSEPAPAAPAAEAAAPAASGTVFTPAASGAPAPTRRVDPVVVVVSGLTGFLLALIGVAVGWRLGRR